MAGPDTTKDGLTPEEQLLRIIESDSPANKQSRHGGVGTAAQQNPAVSTDATLIEGLQIKESPRTGLVKSLGAVLGRSLAGRSALKVVNRLLMVALLGLAGYLAWDVSGTGQGNAAQIPNTGGEIVVPDIPAQPPIDEVIKEVDRRNIFRPVEVKIIETATGPTTPTATATGPTVVEVKSPLTEIIKNFRLIGIMWSAEKPVAIIEDKSLNNQTHCVAKDEEIFSRDQANATREVKIIIKEIAKDKVILQFEDEEKELRGETKW
ncbi:MAG: hypothetical protein HY762_02945 [Planctomycetes bacterium]|nr:hypothetical protein [Planctomycetota bacterium]